MLDEGFHDSLKFENEVEGMEYDSDDDFEVEISTRSFIQSIDNENQDSPSIEEQPGPYVDINVELFIDI